jgi:hypothetical protein
MFKSVSFGYIDPSKYTLEANFEIFATRWNEFISPYFDWTGTYVADQIGCLNTDIITAGQLVTVDGSLSVRTLSGLDHIDCTAMALVYNSVWIINGDDVAAKVLAASYETHSIGVIGSDIGGFAISGVTIGHSVPFKLHKLSTHEFEINDVIQHSLRHVVRTDTLVVEASGQSGLKVLNSAQAASHEFDESYLYVRDIWTDGYLIDPRSTDYGFDSMRRTYNSLDGTQLGPERGLLFQINTQTLTVTTKAESYESFVIGICTDTKPALADKNVAGFYFGIKVTPKVQPLTKCNAFDPNSYTGLQDMSPERDGYIGTALQGMFESIRKDHILFVYCSCCAGKTHISEMYPDHVIDIDAIQKKVTQYETIVDEPTSSEYGCIDENTSICRYKLRQAVKLGMLHGKVCLINSPAQVPNDYQFTKWCRKVGRYKIFTYPGWKARKNEYIAEWSRRISALRGNQNKIRGKLKVLINDYRQNINLDEVLAHDRLLRLYVILHNHFFNMRS